MKIITNNAVSVDGKITTAGRERITLGSKADMANIAKLRMTADAVLVGGNTFRHWPILALAPEDPRVRGAGFIRHVVMTRTMLLNFNYASVPSCVKPLFLTSAPKWPEDLPFEVVRQTPAVTPKWVVEQLAERGVKTLLIEGGGEIIEPFLQERLIDEMHVTLCPKIVGGRLAPTLAGARGFTRETIRQLELLDHRVELGEIFLRYKVRK